jgi:hypothetical protein
VLSAAIIDTLTAQVMTSGSVSTNDGFNSFDFFMWRLPGMGTTLNGGPYDFTRLKVEVGLIPEPSTVALIAVGLGMTAAMLRRRRS